MKILLEVIALKLGQGVILVFFVDWYVMLYLFILEVYLFNLFVEDLMLLFW